MPSLCINDTVFHTKQAEERYGTSLTSLVLLGKGRTLFQEELMTYFDVARVNRAQSCRSYELDLPEGHLYIPSFLDKSCFHHAMEFVNAQVKNFGVPLSPDVKVIFIDNW